MQHIVSKCRTTKGVRQAEPKYCKWANQHQCRQFCNPRKQDTYHLHFFSYEKFKLSSMTPRSSRCLDRRASMHDWWNQSRKQKLGWRVGKWMPMSMSIGSDREKPARPDRYQLLTGKLKFGWWVGKRMPIAMNTRWAKKVIAAWKVRSLIGSFVYIDCRTLYHDVLGGRRATIRDHNL
jgi:hypothetical protein